MQNIPIKAEQYEDTYSVYWTTSIRVAANDWLIYLW